MRLTVFTLTAVAVLASFSHTAEARRMRRSTGNYYYTKSTSPVDNSSAQGVAETMAARGYVAHFGGHGGMYEGCGSGWTEEQAFRNCCYATSTSLDTVDVGYAQGKSGMWYCCRRYTRRYSH